MKITFILPMIGNRSKEKYAKTWQMEPLQIATLKGLTPKNIETEFFDERIEKIDFETETDLVAISVETYSAKRAYQIAEVFLKRNIKVVLGGFHVTLNPDESIEYASSIIVGQAENLWDDVLKDLKSNNLKRKYVGKIDEEVNFIMPDRSIYGDKKYPKVGLVEAGRGCLFNCSFCSITNFYKKKYHSRNINDIIKDIKSMNQKLIFFVDDNLCANKTHASKLFKRLKKLNIKWIGQADITISKNDDLLKLMKDSGCIGVLIGFESLDVDDIESMNKKVNSNFNLESAIRKIHSAGISIYATFVFGFDSTKKETFEKVYDFINKQKFLLVAYNHLVPFPGTPLYSDFKSKNKLLYNSWWLKNDINFGDVTFNPKHMSPKELSDLCFEYRKKVYSFNSMFRRMFNWRIIFKNPKILFYFILTNLLMKRDLNKRQGLPIGRIEND